MTYKGGDDGSNSILLLSLKKYRYIIFGLLTASGRKNFYHNVISMTVQGTVSESCPTLPERKQGEDPEPLVVGKEEVFRPQEVLAAL